MHIKYPHHFSHTTEDTAGQLQASWNQADRSPMSSAALKSSQSQRISKWLNLLVWSHWMYEEGQARKKAEKSFCVSLLYISQYLRYALSWFFANYTVILSKNFEMPFLDFRVNELASAIDIQGVKETYFLD